MFDGLKDEIEYYKKSTLLKILGPILLLAVPSIFLWFWKYIYPNFLSAIPASIKYSLLLLLFILCFLQRAYINHLRSNSISPIEKYPQFGLMWAKNIPYCQKCDKPLTDYIYTPDNQYSPNPYFECHKCGHQNYIDVEEIVNPSLDRVLAKLKK